MSVMVMIIVAITIIVIITFLIPFLPITAYEV